MHHELLHVGVITRQGQVQIGQLAAYDGDFCTHLAHIALFGNDDRVAARRNFAQRVVTRVIGLDTLAGLDQQDLRVRQRSFKVAVEDLSAQRSRGRNSLLPRGHNGGCTRRTKHIGRAGQKTERCGEEGLKLAHGGGSDGPRR